MNSDSDPLLRALTDEDPACPDGRALVALGRLIRDVYKRQGKGPSRYKSVSKGTEDFSRGNEVT